MKANPKRSASRRLRLEQLEGRWMLSADPISFSSDDIGIAGVETDALAGTQIVNGGSRAGGPRDSAAGEGSDRRGPGTQDPNDRDNAGPPRSDAERSDGDRPDGDRPEGDHNGDRPPRRGRDQRDASPPIADTDSTSVTIPAEVEVTIRSEPTADPVVDSTSSNRTPTVSTANPVVDTSPAGSGVAVDRVVLGPEPETDGVGDVMLVSVTPQSELWELTPESIDQVLEAESEAFVSPSTAEAIEAVDQWVDQSDAFRYKIERLDQAIKELAEEKPSADPEAFDSPEETEAIPDTAAEAVPTESPSEEWLLETSGLLLDNDSGPRTVADSQPPRWSESIAAADAGWDVGIGVFKAFESVLPAAPQHSLSAAFFPAVAPPPRLPSPVETSAESDSQRSLAWYQGASLAVITIAGVVYIRRSRAWTVRDPASFV